MKIAISGLGKMGMQLVQKLQADGHTVVAHDINKTAVDMAVTHGALAAYDQRSLIAAFGSEQVVLWLMIPASAVDAVLAGWLELLPKGSLLIDGGNSDFRDTQRHAELVKEKGSLLMDIGTSGGIWGYEKGFAFMVGGDKASFPVIEPALASLAKPGGAYRYFGPSGAGHFVKMTHNAIEYGMMESLAEGYNLLKAGPYPDLNLTAAAEVWQHNSVIDSWLNDLCFQILKQNPNLDGIDGYVAESGEATWALEVAKEKGLPLPAIQSAMDVRLASQQGTTNFATKLLAAMRHSFGGHNLNKES